MYNYPMAKKLDRGYRTGSQELPSGYFQPGLAELYREVSESDYLYPTECKKLCMLSGYGTGTCTRKSAGIVKRPRTNRKPNNQIKSKSIPIN